MRSNGLMFDRRGVPVPAVGFCSLFYIVNPLQSDYVMSTATPETSTVTVVSTTPASGTSRTIETTPAVSAVAKSATATSTGSVPIDVLRNVVQEVVGGMLTSSAVTTTSTTTAPSGSPGGKSNRLVLGFLPTREDGVEAPLTLWSVVELEHVRASCPWGGSV